MNRMMMMVLLASATGCAGAAADAMPMMAYETQAKDHSGADSAGQPTTTDEQLIVEAEARLAVADVPAAAEQVRAAVQELGGKAVRDEVRYRAAWAEFVVRVPPARLSELFDALDPLGKLTDRRVETTDVTKEFHDSAIQLDNLRKALARYQQILEQATNVEEILAVERELTRIRGEIEQIEGERAFLTDRVALATLTLTLVLDRSEAVFAPQAKFHPGISFSNLLLLTEGQPARTYAGPGLSLHFDRVAHLELTLLAKTDALLQQVDGLLLTYGTDVYSDFLGRGKRRFFNPHLGFALGYARIDDVGSFTAAGALGVELFKSEMVLVDATVRLHGMAHRGGPSLGVESALTVNVAY